MGLARDIQLGMVVTPGTKDAWQAIIDAGVRQTGSTAEAKDKSSDTRMDIDARSSSTYIVNMVNSNSPASISKAVTEKSFPLQKFNETELLKEVSAETENRNLEQVKMRDENKTHTQNDIKNTPTTLAPPRYEHKEQDVRDTVSNDPEKVTRAVNPKPTEDVRPIAEHAPAKDPEVADTADLPTTTYSDPVVMDIDSSAVTYKPVKRKKRSILGKIGDAFSSAWDSVKEFGTEAWGVISGDEKEKREAIAAQKEKLDKMKADTEAKIDTLKNRIGTLEFFPEIFQLSATNQLKFTYQRASTEFNIELEKYNSMAEGYQEDYKMMISQTETFLGKLVWGIIKIVGGLGRDLFNAVFHLDWDAFLRILHVVVDVGFIVIAVLTLQWWAVPILVLDLLLYLDRSYADGLISMALMRTLDFVLNDVLHLEDAIPWFNRFDEDSKYYQETMMYLQLIIQLSGMIAKLFIAPYVGKYIAAEVGSLFDFGEGLNTVKEIADLGYAGYSTYAAVKSAREQYAEANEAYENLAKELKDKREKAQKRYLEARSRKMRRAYQEADMYVGGVAIFTANNVASCNSDITNAYNPVARIPYNLEKETSCDNEGTNFGYQQYLEPVNYKDY